MDHRVSSTRLLWAGGFRLSSAFVGVAGANAMTVAGADEGMPLDALAAMAVTLGVASVLAIPTLLAIRARVGMAAASTFSLALASLGMTDAYLWTSW